MNSRTPPYIIDIEASGFGPESYPIEVGVVLDAGQKYCSLIQPAPDWSHWDNEAELMHGLTRTMLALHGKAVQIVARQLNAMLQGKILYSDGWVVDKPWLTTLFHAAGQQMAFTVSPLEMLLSEAQMAIWHPTKERILTTLHVTRHRASNDAWVIQETYRLTQQLTLHAQQREL